MDQIPPNSSRWQLPLAEAYRQLNPLQAQCLRGWLVHQFEWAIPEQDSIQSSSIAEFKQLIKEFKLTQGQLTPEQNHLLSFLFYQAQLTGCDSILGLFAYCVMENAQLRSTADPEQAKFCKDIERNLANDIKLFPGLLLNPELQLNMRKLRDARQLASHPELIPGYSSRRAKHDSSPKVWN